MSKENVISKKEPFARMVKRDHISVGKAWAIRLIAVALSLVVAALVIVAVTKQNPIEVYLGIIDGAVGSNRRYLGDHPGNDGAFMHCNWSYPCI